MGPLEPARQIQNQASPFGDGRAMKGSHVIMEHRSKDSQQTDVERRITRQESVQEIMTPAPRALDTAASAVDAAEVMRDCDIGDVVVLQDDHLYGILTDRDIVVRVLAERRDPATVQIGAICSRELTTIAPSASIGEAVRLIRDKALRRLPVVDGDGEIVGIVSIGDIAVARDRKSALADVSGAAPNT